MKRIPILLGNGELKVEFSCCNEQQQLVPVLLKETATSLVQ